MRVGSLSVYGDFNFDRARCSRISRGSAWSSASSASESSSVEGWPDGVFFFTGSLWRSNRISWICFGEPRLKGWPATSYRSEEHTSELQSQSNLVCRLLLE